MSDKIMELSDLTSEQVALLVEQTKDKGDKEALETSIKLLRQFANQSQYKQP